MKKFISFLLAVAMLVAFIPTAFAAEATLEKSGVKVVYDVRNVMKTLQMPSLGAAVQMTAINYDETKGFFEWLPGNTGHYAGPTSAVFTYKQVADGTQCFGMANEAKLSFEINIPKAGIYDFEMYNCVENTPQLEGKAIIDNAKAEAESFLHTIENNKVKIKAFCEELLEKVNKL